MARLDVYPMPGRNRRGYVLDVQASLLDHLATRVVVPLLLEADAPPPIKGLNPTFLVNGESCVMITQAVAAVSRKELRRATFSLDAHHDEVLRALDILLIG